MERGREGRRGSGGGGLVHPPKRPRTGFKDAAGPALSDSSFLSLASLFKSRSCSTSFFLFSSDYLEARAFLLATIVAGTW